MEAKNNADKIEGILEDFNDGTIDNIVDDNTLVFAENDEETLRKAREAREKEIMERVGLAKKEAEAIVSSAKDLYGKSASDVSYVQFKAKADADSLGKILFQVEQTEDVIKVIADAILCGDINPNLVKCFSDLQKTEMELLKTKNLYLTSIESSFKQITTDVEMTAAIEVESEDENEVSSAKTRSSRDLQRLLEIAAEKVKEARSEGGDTDGDDEKAKLF